MKDYLKQFATIGQYESWLSSNNYIEPSVSHTLDNNVTHYQPISPHDYSKDYLTFTALEDTTFTFTTNALQYSLDNGTTWTTLAANTATPTVTAGNKILWKQTGLTPGTTSVNYGIGTFSATGNFEASGNIMSLHYGDNFVGQTDLTGKNFAFAFLFNVDLNNKLVDAENLILPATTLAQSCYHSMFKGCRKLTTAPKLPTTTLANLCYSNMFSDCKSLTTAPTLPATTLVQGCYHSMFKGCSALETAPTLPATTLSQRCYQAMFNGCSVLKTAPELPAATLADYCYMEMFSDCKSLNYIKCLATDISASNCTYNWVYGIPNWVYDAPYSGTFIKANSMSDWTTGTNGIPSGWLVQDAA